MNMVDVYGSFNEAIAELWTGGAPGVPLLYDRPVSPATLPAECQLLDWSEHGTTTGLAGDPAGLVQLSVFVPDQQLAIALERAQGLDKGMGLEQMPYYGRLELFDDVGAPAGWADVRALEPIWLRIPDDTPGIIHLARTVELVWA
jgi:hypothetical protein